MKITTYLISVLMILVVSCHDKADTLCETLSKDLVHFNVEGVQAMLNEWLLELPPGPNGDDLIGHQNNLESFTNRLATDCDFNASIICYACIETFPVQSEVSVMVDSSGQTVLRVLDLRTPQNDFMTVLNVHQ